MVNIKIFKDQDKKWIGFSVEGHAQENISSEYDLVCCAISFHFQNIEDTLQNLLEGVVVEKRWGFLKVKFTRVMDEKTAELLDGVELVFLNGINILKKEYQGYIKSTKIKEVERDV